MKRKKKQRDTGIPQIANRILNERKYLGDIKN